MSTTAWTENAAFDATAVSFDDANTDYDSSTVSFDSVDYSLLTPNTTAWTAVEP